jgi:hypothetical protein
MAVRGRFPRRIPILADRKSDNKKVSCDRVILFESSCKWVTYRFVVLFGIQLDRVVSHFLNLIGTAATGRQGSDSSAGHTHPIFRYPIWVELRSEVPGYRLDGCLQFTGWFITLTATILRTSQMKCGSTTSYRFPR